MNSLQIYIVLTPEFEGYFNGKSLPAYGRMGKVENGNSYRGFSLKCFILQVFLIDEVGSDIFLKQVQEFETNNCLWKCLNVPVVSGCRNNNKCQIVLW